MPAGRSLALSPHECSPAAGRGAPKQARGGDNCPYKAALVGPWPADAWIRCCRVWEAVLGPVLGPLAVAGVLPAHTCPSGVVAWDQSPGRRGQAVGGRGHTWESAGRMDVCGHVRGWSRHLLAGDGLAV